MNRIVARTSQAQTEYNRMMYFVVFIIYVSNCVRLMVKWHAVYDLNVPTCNVNWLAVERKATSIFFLAPSTPLISAVHFNYPMHRSIENNVLFFLYLLFPHSIAFEIGKRLIAKTMVALEI